MVCRFKRGLCKKEGVVFLRGGVDIPNAHYGYDWKKELHQINIKGVLIIAFCKNKLPFGTIF